MLALIRVGYDMAFHFPAPTAMVLMLSLHPSCASTIRKPERLEVQPDVAVSEFIDAFVGIAAAASSRWPGAWCCATRRMPYVEMDCDAYSRVHDVASPRRPAHSGVEPCAV
jgi:hypothetical protein